MLYSCLYSPALGVFQSVQMLRTEFLGGSKTTRFTIGQFTCGHYSSNSIKRVHSSSSPSYIRNLLSQPHLIHSSLILSVPVAVLSVYMSVYLCASPFLPLLDMFRILRAVPQFLQLSALPVAYKFPSQTLNSVNFLP